MEYFGLTALSVAPVSFSLFVLVDLLKIIGPLLFPYMTTSDVPILMVSPSSRPLGVRRYFLSMFPYRIDRPSWPSNPTILLDLCLVTRLR
jgi:hypothetical protein